MISRRNPATISGVRSFIYRILLSVPLVFMIAVTVRAEPWFGMADAGRVSVVVGVDPNPPILEAAKLFTDTWEVATGDRPDIRANPVDSSVHVWIGPAGYNEFPTFLGGEGLTDEGYVIRTLDGSDDVNGRHLLLVGNSPRATIYAVWSFLETYLGARAFAPEVITVPSLPGAIPRIHERSDPDYWYRDINYQPFLEDRRMAAMNQLNGQWTRVPQRYGGHLRYIRGLAGHGHTFHYFVDPEEYFDAHPEYFAEIEGERIKEAQLCLTNEDVLAITIDKVRALLRERRPNERIVSVSQMDYFWFDSWCTCEECRALDEYEESHAGSLIHFVNSVADAIADEFPEVYVDTFAYLHTRTPPKHVRPRDNVIIRLCGIECDYSVPLTDRRSEANRAFLRDLRRWRAISSQLFVWLYTQNWYAFQAPHPTTPTFRPNIEFLQSAEVDGVFLQASPEQANSDQQALKSYLLGRLLREPNLDWRESEEEFLREWYGPSAPAVRNYLRLLRSHVAETDRPLWFVNDLEWLDADIVAAAQALVTDAVNMASSSEIRDRLRRFALPISFASMVCPPEVYRRSDAYVFVRPPGPTFDAYWHELQELGVTHLNDYPIDALRRRMDGRAPPRYEVADIVKLSSERFEAWIVPARGGAVVRLRDRELREDWVPGYRMIRETAGRVQPWTTTDPDRWIEPEPANESTAIVDQSERHVTLERTLENGLVVRHRVAIHAEGIDVALSVLNPTDVEIVPKVSLFAEFLPPDGGPAQLWRRQADDWKHARPRGRFRRGVSDVDTSPSEASSVAISYPGVRRSVVVELDDSAFDTVIHDPRSPHGLLRIGADMTREGVPAGSDRTMALRYTFWDRSPNRH